MGEINRLSKEEREACLSELKAGEEPERIGEVMAWAIERSDSSRKAVLLGRLFCLLAHKKIDPDSYWLLHSAIPGIPHSELRLFVSLYEMAERGETLGAYKFPASSIGNMLFAYGLARLEPPAKPSAQVINRDRTGYPSVSIARNDLNFIIETWVGDTLKAIMAEGFEASSTDIRDARVILTTG